LLALSRLVLGDEAACRMISDESEASRTTNRKGVGAKLFPESVKILFSKTTGRIRTVSLNGERLATLRPTDGLLSLSITAARRIAENADFAQCFVSVRDDVSKFVADGSDVFAAHVVKADGLAAGKGVILCATENDALKAIDLLNYIFNYSTANLHPLFYPFSEAFIQSLRRQSQSR
jgi:archaeosine-15-forming tRNA-guanine transglycosylase